MGGCWRDVCVPVRFSWLPVAELAAGLR